MNKSVESQILDILEEYKDKASDAVETCSKSTAKDTAKMLKRNSPKRSGDYAKGWTTKKLKNGGYVVYNKPHYRLTHLLENGHVYKDRYGFMKRTKANHHIKDAEEWGINEYMNRLKKELEKK